MWDKIERLNLGLLISYVAAFNFYLYELFCGSWTIIQTKSFYYLVTSFVLLTLTIQDHFTRPNQFNIICKYVIIVNFIIIYFTLRGMNLKNNLFYYNGLIFAMSVIVMICAHKHEYFKRNEND